MRIGNMNRQAAFLFCAAALLPADLSAQFRAKDTEWPSYAADLAVTEIIRLDAPGNFQFAEIGSVDLVQRAVARPRQVGGVAGPLRIFRVELSR